MKDQDGALSLVNRLTDAVTDLLAKNVQLQTTVVSLTKDLELERSLRQKMAGELKESIERTDHELSVISLAKQAVAAHNENLSKLQEAEQRVARLASDLEQARAEKAEERRIAGEAWAQIRVLEQTVYDLRCEKESLERDLDKSLKGEADAVAACDANWVQHQRIVKAEQQLKQANELLRQVQTLDVLDDDGFHWITGGIAAHLCMQSKEIK